MNKSINQCQLSEKEWKPDFGPDQMVARWGATASGVRKFLIAYNINVVGTKEQAHRFTWLALIQSLSIH